MYMGFASLMVLMGFWALFFIPIPETNGRQGPLFKEVLLTIVTQVSHQLEGLSGGQA